MSAYRLTLLAIFLTANQSIDGAANVSRTSTTLTAPLPLPESRSSVESFLLSTACLQPFEASGDLCLSFNKSLLSWHKAEALCVSQGGHLVWMQSRMEHNVIRGFVMKKGRRGYFWTGLRKYPNGSMSWSNGRRSSYRGNPFTQQEMPYVSADSRDHQFDGDGKAVNLPTVCRQQSRGDSQEPNLMMILEHNRMEIEDQVKQITIFAMGKVINSINSMPKALQKVLVECPRPWIRFEGMCLMYIFQLRSWSDAEDLCTVQGGTLVWYNDDKERKLVESLKWTPHVRRYKFFWIGLHKGNSGKLIWTGHNGMMIKLDNEGKYVAVNHETGDYYITDDDSIKFSAICRRLI